VEGSGIDFVQFKVPVAGITGSIQVKAKMYYQSVPPKWLDEMFTFNSAEIDTFRNMYTGADKSPVLVGSDSITEVLTSISSATAMDLKVFPTLTQDGLIFIELPNHDNIIRIEAVDASGKKFILRSMGENGKKTKYQLPSASGLYFIRVETKLGSKTVRVLRL
jgi:hypothetical protein